MGETVAHSPLPTGSKTAQGVTVQSPGGMSPGFAPDSITPVGQVMDFYQAVRRIAGGATVRRMEWPDGFVTFMKNDVLTIRKPDGTEHNWIIKTGDIAGMDWVLI